MQVLTELPITCLNDCLDYLLDFGLPARLYPGISSSSSWLKVQEFVKTPVEAFEFGLSRSDVTVVRRSIANIDVAPEHSSYHDSLVDDIPVESSTDQEIYAALNEMFDRASDGLTFIHTQALRNLVYKFVDISRVKLSADCPD